MKLEGEGFDQILEFKNIFTGPSYERLKKDLMAKMMRQKDQVFDRSSAPDGSAWAPLSKKAAARRTAKAVKAGAKDPTNHKILLDTGKLRNSLTDASAPYGLRSTDNDEVKIGTNVPYANIHQYGGMIITNNLFGKMVRESITIIIPARPFVGFGGNDEAELAEITEHYLENESGTV